MAKTHRRRDFDKFEAKARRNQKQHRRGLNHNRNFERRDYQSNNDQNEDLRA